MSMKGKTLVKGHTLVREGWPHWSNDDPLNFRSKKGRGKCSCGAMSEWLGSTAQRKRWHKQHKAEVLRKMEVKA